MVPGFPGLFAGTSSRLAVPARVPLVSTCRSVGNILTRSPMRSARNSLMVADGQGRHHDEPSPSPLPSPTPTLVGELEPSIPALTSSLAA